MAALFDAATIGENSNSLTLTFSHTVGAGSDRFLLVGVTCYDDLGNTTSGVTYNGVAMTKIDSTLFNHTNTNEISLWGLINPASGAHNVVVTCTANNNAATEIECGAVSYTEVHQTVAWGTPSKIAVEPVTSTSRTITDSVAGDLVVDVVAWFNQAITRTGDQNATRIANDNGGSFDSIYMSEAPGAASVIMSWSWVANESPGHIAVAIKQSGAITREQEGYRWRADDGSETTATWLASQDTDISRAKLTNTRLRILTNVTSDAPSEAVKLQYRKVGAAGWRDVTT